jgi:hypothetical protein
MKLKIYDKIYDVKKFSTRRAAENFIDKKPKRILIFFSASKYYVTI